MLCWGNYSKSQLFLRKQWNKGLTIILSNYDEKDEEEKEEEIADGSMIIDEEMENDKNELDNEVMEEVMEDDRNE